MPLKNRANNDRRLVNQWSYPNLYSQSVLFAQHERVVQDGGVDGYGRNWKPLSYQVMTHNGSSREQLSDSWTWTANAPPLGVTWTNLGRYSHIYQGIEWPNANWGNDFATLNACNLVVTNKLLARLRDARTQWNAAISLGESASTARMISRRASQVAQSFVSLRRGNVKMAYRHLTSSINPGYERSLQRRYVRNGVVADVSGAWMELQFGWVPLLADIDQAARFIAWKRFFKEPGLIRVSARHAVEQSGSWLQDEGPQNGNPNLDMGRLEYFWKNASDVKVTYELIPKWAWEPLPIDEMSATQLGQIKRNWGGQDSILNQLGFTNPAFVAWNLLPLSFVADWFLGIGRTLESLHEFQQWRVKRGIRSSKSGFERGSSRIKQPAASGPPDKLTSSNLSLLRKHPYQSLQTYRYTRSLESSLPSYIPLSVKVSNPFDLKTGVLASAAALLATAFNDKTSKSVLAKLFRD